MNEPKVHVGILFEPQIEFTLLNPYRMDGTLVSGKQVVTYNEGKILWNGRCYEELLFEPQHESTDAFELLDVTIGINFHWERKEDQRFLGALKIIVENGKLTGINVIHVEDYLTSVISSEMSATASLELLKAHAVISRSWLLAQIQKNKEIAEANTEYSTFTQTEEELIRWYDREDHTRFDVCADDHCQRYQGITRASTDMVKQAIAATRGQVLTSDQKICDARFSKCCGGAFEEFQYCWEDLKHSYLAKQRDYQGASSITAPHTADSQWSMVQTPDLTQEAEADRWIRTSPEAFCNTTDKKILSQVLNNYDQETTDFYRWKVEYTQDELAKLIQQRSGIDYGQIIDLIPIARGTSARLWKLKIVGTKKTLIIGKELEIRRTLSSSHLYSSAFVVDKEEVSSKGIPGRFILTGAGWGHGAGLCQIGAAVMGEKGYPYDTILLHYYIGANIDKLYA
ncbi:SpoIID/LytB domain-containing protein [uncultured Bacteroides sp.]|uniref:SpoIID/LytB domain-containing protein n=1 Tax=uncultured Bacteroides sp. TaxID=162156 RepID=UPI00262A30DF|nr:SpoIID/LytB domain-containing protein [uncultured Bacteroides sp.]